MSKTCFLYALLFVISVNAEAQLRIHANDYGEVGDTFLVVIDTAAAGINIGEPGTGKIWDFSTLQNHNKRVIRFLDPDSTPFAGDFPNSGIAMDEGTNVLTYITIDQAGYSIDGTASEQFGVPFANVLTPPLAFLEFPAAYGFAKSDVNESRNAQYIGQEIQGIKIDSLGIKTTITSNREIDAYGTITTPAGKYECVRLRNTQTTKIAVETYAIIFGNFGIWTPLFDSTIQTDIYMWIARGQGHPVAEARTGPSGDVQDIRYLEASSFEYQPLFEKIKVFPNPVLENKVTVYLPEDSEGGPFVFGLYDIAGQLVWDAALDLGSNNFDLQSLAGGVYVAGIRSENSKKAIYSQKLIVVR